MPAAVLADWKAAISSASYDELEQLVREALASAEKARDREAYIALRALGSKRAKALATATPPVN
jgi:hypothetical protein